MNTSDFINRRSFLQRATGLALGASAANAIFDLRLINTALAQGGIIYPDYKALVCVFLSGGNDGNNILIPFDTEGYANYSGIRGTGLALFRDAPSATANGTNGNVYYGLPLDYFRRLPSQLTQVRGPDLPPLAQRYFDPASMLVIAVGDRASLQPALDALKLGPLEVWPIAGRLF